MNRMICNGLCYSYFLIEHMFWIFVTIASVRQFQLIPKICVPCSIKCNVFCIKFDELSPTADCLRIRYIYMYIYIYTLKYFFLIFTRKKKKKKKEENYHQFVIC